MPKIFENEIFLSIAMLYWFREDQMNKNNGCKVRECISNHRREIVGGVFLVLATLLTILTLSGLGIFGMFITGLAMCCHRHMCFCRNNMHGCCEDELEANSEHTEKPAVRKTAKTSK